MQLSIKRALTTTKKLSLPRGAGLWIALLVLVVASSLVSPYFLSPTVSSRSCGRWRFTASSGSG